MKRILMTQYGERVVEQARTFVIDIPDEVDPDRIDEAELERLADEAGIGWEEIGDNDVSADWHEVENEEAGIAEYENVPVVTWLEKNQKEQGVNVQGLRPRRNDRPQGGRLRLRKR